MPDVVQVGAGVLIKVNGQVLGFATYIEWQRTQGVKPFYEVDSPFPAEISPAGPYLVTGVLMGLRLRDMGGLDGPQITNAANVADFFTQQYVTLTIQDKISGQNLGNVNRCMFDRDSFRIEAKNIATFTASFMGIWVSNEVSTDSAG
jgi:hypothetical protein